MHIALGTLTLVLAVSAAWGGECRALIILGDPGPEPNSAARFADWTVRWAGMLKDIYGFSPANIRVLRSPARAGQPRPDLANVPPAELASHQNVLAAFADLVRNSNDGDQVVLVLIGHGYDTQGISKLCLPGKDLSDVEAARALDLLRAKQFICINTAPASAPWAKALARSGRGIIVASATPGLRSQTYFSEFLLRALKPGGISLLDGFNRASLQTIRWYQNQFLKDGAMLVHGREFQGIWKAMYPDKEMIAGSDEPKEPNNNMEDMTGWLGRRVLPEVAGLEDNADGVPSTVYEDNKQPTPLPAKAGDGLFSRTIILGKP